ncbi:hypothetical protein [Cupriavidus sp. IDO]|jgi:hypothetical protein|uniref:hypothetical protein n=1 Tax=Cupriavidus sp. IDO TaxID=1539142 RepID=UPI00057961DA|nr:hypothetical protein [Cupriavidus sp. IDO]KWR90465.1 hypothetical protein RM96_08445 [Cupriavidus sp. IDO]
MPFRLRLHPTDIYPDPIEAKLSELREIAAEVQRAHERKWRRHGTLLPVSHEHAYARYPLGNPDTRH